MWRLDRALAVDRLAERIDDASEHPFSDRHLQKFAGGFDLSAFLDFRVFAEDDRADFGFFEVQREAGDAVPEIKHLVQHRARKAFNFCDAVADFANGADVLFGRSGFDAGDLRLNFL